MLDATPTDAVPTFDPPAPDARALRDAFGRFATGVTVVSFRGEDGRATGVTVSSFTSLSLDPPLCLFSLARTQPSASVLARPGARFVVNVLGRGQEALAWRFAKPAADKFEGVAAARAPCGTPAIEGALARFECEHWATHDGGDHVIVVGRIARATEGEGEPMVFYRGAATALGA